MLCAGCWVLCANTYVYKSIIVLCICVGPRQARLDWPACCRDLPNPKLLLNIDVPARMTSQALRIKACAVSMQRGGYSGVNRSKADMYRSGLIALIKKRKKCLILEASPLVDIRTCSWNRKENQSRVCYAFRTSRKTNRH